MNVVFTFAVTWPHHIATELELLQSHLDAGDNVVVLTCFDDLEGCVSNISHSPRACRRCMRRRFSSLRLLDRPVRVESFSDYLTPEDRKDESLVRVDFESVEAAQGLEIDDWDVGYAAISTAVHHFRDAGFQASEARKTWQRMLVSGFRTYRATRSFLKHNSQTDRVYIFNGRFAIARGVLRACQHQGVEAILHERGCDNTKYSIYKNHLPHDRQPFLERAEKAWKEVDVGDGTRIGAEFFERRRRGVEDAWTSFVKNQDAGRLPESWSDTQKNLVIFNSSEDEFIGIGGEWKNPIYESQAVAIEQIVRDLANDDIRIYVRMHPNLTDVDNEDTRRIRALDGEGAEIIPADSSVSTYDLLEQAEKVLCFGSTVGVEANYWGVPAILAGVSFYRDLDVAYNANDHAEVLRLIRSNLEPKDKSGALKYGYYMRTFGIPFVHYEADSFHGGRFGKRRLFSLSTPATMILPTLVKLTGNRPRLFRFFNSLLRLLFHYPFVPFAISWTFLRSIGRRLRGKRSQAPWLSGWVG